MWVLSSDDWENDLEHSLQINGFSLELVLRCALRLSDTEKALEQSEWMVSLLNVFFLRLPESEKDLKHSLQVNGFLGEF